MINYNLSKKEFKDHVSEFYYTIDHAAANGYIIDIILENKQKITIEFSSEYNDVFFRCLTRILAIRVPKDTQKNRELNIVDSYLDIKDWTTLELDTSKIIAIVERGFADKKYGTIHIE